MNLAEYERIKFELAAILRSAQVRLRQEQPKVHAPFLDLFGRLAEDRFNLVMVGRFSRGKSSLMNALLETERLPMGIVPITSVITTVAYGSSERAFIIFQGSHLELALTLDKLPDYITQQGNPANRRGVAAVRIELPSELLRRGFYFVDTPGLGSSIVANTLTTERFLPQADAFMLVTSFDSPLSEEELQTLRRVASSTSRIFVVINKQDMASATERTEVVAHVREQALRVFGEPIPRIFSVSAREALEANRQRDGARYVASGVDELRAEVTQFLLTDKHSDFLCRMCERVADALKEAPYSREDSDRLRALRQTIVQSRPDSQRRQGPAASASGENTTGFKKCQICEQLDQGLYDFLCHYQWEIASRRTAQTDLAERGGLCAFHYWQLASVASPHGICVGLSAVVDHWAACLRIVASRVDWSHYQADWEGLQPTPSTCDMCRTHIDIERVAVERMARGLGKVELTMTPRGSGLCLPHLGQVIGAIGSESVARELLMEEAAALQRLSEDMRRYALKHDGVRRAFASEEEFSADRRALMLLGGHRNVFALGKLG
jgi:GTPase Era involved in 16S rRNA processing